MFLDTLCCLMQCKISEKRLTARAGKAAGGKKRTKLLVRNLAFQATIREVRELFGSFGKVKTVRIPKKFDGSHRGFAFVEFLTAQEAASAYEALSATHLYGRHLVIEWAEEGAEDDVEALRGKAAKDLRGARGPMASDAPLGAKGGDDMDM
jgi:multiple RNA-binding domain-containing protein 1